MLDWLIVGGGIHGTYLANLLLTRLGVPHDRVMIIDPLDSPCQRWKELTSKTGMVFLRSGITQHVDVDEDSLREFRRRKDVCGWARTFGPTDRPSLRLFNAHIDHVIDKAGIYRCYRIARATGICNRESFLEVKTDIGVLRTRNLILAISPTETPLYPDWAKKLKQAGGSVRHVFDSDFDARSVVPGFSYAVVGRGLTAAQMSLHAAELSPGRVHMLSKGGTIVWDIMGGADETFMDRFLAEPDMSKRRSMLRDARQKGSVPQETADALHEASVVDKVLRYSYHPVKSARLISGGKSELTLTTGRRVVVDRVLLATGFNQTCPGTTWLSRVCKKMELPLHTDGYPLVDSHLRWHPRIFVTGALAELELGPTARNVNGARLAGERLIDLLDPDSEADSKADDSD